MTSALLEEVSLYFPSPEQRMGGAFAGWRAHITMLREYLAAFDSSDRRALFDAAHERIQEADFRDPNEMWLWFFSHPTFEIFEEFLRDESICRSMADHFEFCMQSKRSTKRVRRRRFRHQQHLRGREGALLPLRYGELLERHEDDLYLKHYYLNADRSGYRITLVSLHDADIDENSTQALYVEAENRIVKQELDQYLIGLTRFTVTDLAKIYGLDDSPLAVSRAEIQIFEFLFHEALVELEVSDFDLVFPDQLRSVTKLSASMLDAMQKGTWVKFSVQFEQHTRASAAKKITYKMDMAVLDAIRSHRSEVIAALSGATQDIEIPLQQVRYGLLSVGLKIHCADSASPGVEFLKRGVFQAHNAGTCFNLPPVGNIEALAELLEVIQRRAGISYLDNPDFQIQVCSPGVLTSRDAALLGIAFYLGSDRIRKYVPGDFVTTHRETGDRFVIYGAGVLDRSFRWWGANRSRELVVRELPQGIVNRTDVLTCQSMRDIENVNLVATLLVHVQHHGYWRMLGLEFIEEMEAMLARHQLAGILEADWCRRGSFNAREQQDQMFLDALTELMNYAHDEVVRITHAYETGDHTAGSHSILFEMHELLDRYRTEIRVQSPATGDPS